MAPDRIDHLLTRAKIIEAELRKLHQPGVDDVFDLGASLIRQLADVIRELAGKPPRTRRLQGLKAIEYAEAHGKLLSKLADSLGFARNNLTSKEARQVARDKPESIYLDVPEDAI